MSNSHIAILVLNHLSSSAEKSGNFAVLLFSSVINVVLKIGTPSMSIRKMESKKSLKHCQVHCHGKFSVWNSGGSRNRTFISTYINKINNRIGNMKKVTARWKPQLQRGQQNQLRVIVRKLISTAAATWKWFSPRPYHYLWRGQNQKGNTLLPLQKTREKEKTKTNKQKSAHKKEKRCSFFF